VHEARETYRAYSRSGEPDPGADDEPQVRPEPPLPAVAKRGREVPRRMSGRTRAALAPREDPDVYDSVGVVVTVLIGVVGAIAGGLVAEALGWAGLGSFFDLRTWIIAVAGSVVLLATLARSGRDPLTH
jgi:uncharacterized membrane protein YeaQ/YmgE (transglycosylase-associated protein family)